MIAHEQHRALRESYAADVLAQMRKAEAEAKDAKPAAQAPWERVRSAFFRPASPR